VIVFADAVERFLGDRRAGRSVDVEEFAPDVSPAADLGDPVSGGQLVEARKAVGKDDAPEVLQMRLPGFPLQSGV
jgi:hypothetical protein